jgi:hypothetical protein
MVADHLNLSVLELSTSGGQEVLNMNATTDRALCVCRDHMPLVIEKFWAPYLNLWD